MRVGIPKEIKDHEYRVGATPATVRAFLEAGHQVVVEAGAGKKIGFSDKAYREVGAHIVETATEVYATEMVIKVKEPQEIEYPLLREGLILFCFLHLAAEPVLAKCLIESQTVAVAYETVTDLKGRLPLLVPMSEIAGRIAIQVGAVSLQLNNGGKGILLGGVPGVPPAEVIVIGGGVVGTEAARMAMGLGANVTVIDRNLEQLQVLDQQFGPNLKTLYSTTSAIEEAVARADLVIGAVLIPGKRAPKLVTHEMLQQVGEGSVFVDVAIDQGGCFETSRPTTHTDPTYVVDGVVHYCVTNMPGACARTSTIALTNATTDYALAIANKGVSKALKENSGLRDGLNTYLGKMTYEPVAQDLNYPYIPPQTVL